MTSATSVACGSCEVAYINGVRCHESGCPDAWQDESRECAWCGSEYRPTERDDRACSHSCEMSYSGQECECEVCVPFFMQQAPGA